MTSKKEMPCAAATEQSESQNINRVQDTAEREKKQAPNGFFSRICRDYGIYALPLQESMNIVELLSLGNGEELDQGCAVRAGDYRAIFYDAEAEPWEKQLIIAHELGHQLLGHTRPSNYKKPGGETQEQEARIFSTVLTALMLYDEYRRPKQNATYGPLCRRSQGGPA